MRSHPMIQPLRALTLTILALGALTVTVPSPSARAEADKGNRARMEMLRTASECFIEVRYTFKRDLEAERDRYGFEDDAFYGQMAMEKRFVRSSAVLIAPGRALLADPYLSPKHLDRVEVLAVGGEPVPATVDAILLRTPALRIVFDASLPGATPVRFVEKPDLAFGDPLAGVAIQTSGEEWRVTGAGIGPTPALGPGASCPNCYSVSAGSAGSDMMMPSWSGFGEGRFSTSPILVFDASGAPVGLSFGNRLDFDHQESIWLGRDILNAEVLPWTDYLARRDELKERFQSQFVQVLIEFRQDAEDSDYWYGRYYGYGGDNESREMYLYGLPVSATAVFVPRFLNRSQARTIDTITVTVGEDTYTGTFAGTYEAYGAFLVTVNEPVLSEIPPFDIPLPPPYVQPWYGLTVRHRFGRKDAEIAYGRNEGWMRDYRNVLYLRPGRDLAAGDFLSDLDGRLSGVILTIRREGEEERQMSGRGSRYSHGGDRSGRIVSLADLRPLLDDPAPHLDRNIQQMTKEEAKRRAWMGVEFSRMTPDLARFLKVEKPTKNGSIGMIINTVYPGSPAETMGIRVGDIVLTIKRAGEAEPTELMPPHTYDFGFYHFENFRTSDADLGYDWELPPPWRDRQNYFTELLGAIGEGKTIEITWWNGTDRVTREMTIERAPVDFQSAPRFRDRNLGLTVRDLTYEVRNALQLPPERGGVVISKVESGSPGAIAALRTHELILEVDGQVVTGARDFEDRIKALRESGAAGARLTIWSLGVTRFADIDLTATAPALSLFGEEFDEEFGNGFGSEFGSDTEDEFDMEEPYEE